MRRNLLIQLSNSVHVWLLLLAAGLLFPLAAWEQTPTAGLTFSLPSGRYADDVTVAIRSAHPVRYTLDGSLPAETHGAVYTQPLHVTAAGVTVIRARAFPAGRAPTEVETATYVVGLDTPLPVLSLAVEPAALWDAEAGIYANPLEKGSGWERPVDVTFIDTNAAGFQVPAGLRIHGGYTRTYPKKSLRLYFRSEYGPGRLDYPLFAAGDSFDRLVLHSGGQDGPDDGYVNWSLLRNQLIGRLARETQADATRSRPVLLAINGELWGIYHLRERVDDAFLADTYQIASADMLDTPADRYPAVAGDYAHWEHLIAYVGTHDLADPAAYAYVQTQIDIKNFVDYTLLQIYSANADWPQHNINQYRPRVQGGKWHWLLWDSDFSFGLAPLSRPDKDMMRQALRLRRDGAEGEPNEIVERRDVLLLRRLLDNPDFRDLFLTRAAMLLHTTLASKAVEAQLDALVGELQPAVALESSRWSHSVEWHNSIADIRAFIRARPEYVRRHMLTHFGLPGTATLQFKAPVQGKGTLHVGGYALPGLPAGGEYFVGTTLTVTAVPAAGYRFAGWEETDEASPTLTRTLQSAQTFTPRFEPLSPE